MKRDDLINSLVTRKMSANGRTKPGCVPCFGAAARKLCWHPGKKICWSPAKPKN